MADNEKKGAGWKLLALAGVVAAVAGLADRRSDQRDDREAEQAAEDLVAALTPVKVTYKVAGTTFWADVTMETPDGTQQATPDLPMTSEETGRAGLTMEFSPGDFVYVSAQNKERTGTIRCTIIGSDGTVIAQNESDGAYAIATCEGTAR